MDDLNVYDIEFLHGCANPTIILIHQDVNGRHVKTHEISLREKQFVKIPWRQDNIETDASIIIPVPSPLEGAIIIGQESIMYHDGTTKLAVDPPVIRVIQYWLLFFLKIGELIVFVFCVLCKIFKANTIRKNSH